MAGFSTALKQFFVDTFTEMTNYLYSYVVGNLTLTRLTHQNDFGAEHFFQTLEESQFSWKPRKKCKQLAE